MKPFGLIFALAVTEPTAAHEVTEAAVPAAPDGEGAVEPGQAELDCADAITQTDMNICSFRKYQSADRQMNDAWSAASAAAKADDAGGGGNFDRLLDAQRKWLAFRDAQCLAENGPREESGTIWPLLQNGCLKQLTEKRTQQLREYVETGN